MNLKEREKIHQCTEKGGSSSTVTGPKYDTIRHDRRV